MTRAIYSVPVMKRAEAAADQFRAAAAAGQTAMVTYKRNRGADAVTVELELCGLGGQLAGAYAPCLVAKEPGARFSYDLIPLVMLVRIEPKATP